MSGFKNILDDYLSAYKDTSGYKDGLKLEIMLRRAEFEKNLDQMWKNYQAGVVAQIVNYQKQVKEIKNTGLKILRNSEGKHKIKTAL